MSSVNEARKEFEKEVRRLCGKSGYQLAEKLIDLIREVRGELREVDGVRNTTVIRNAAARHGRDV